MNPPEIRGVLAVIQTPFEEDGAIDFACLQGEIDWLFREGADGIVMGMVSEVSKMTEAERDSLVAAAVRAARGRGPVIASVGAESIAQARRHAQAAEKLGADALMAIPPALTRSLPDEVRAYYEGILQASSKPVIVQDASGYFGNAIPIELQAELFRAHPTRIAFKPEAPPLGANLSALRDATEGKAAIYEGSGGIGLVDSFRRGITGTMPGADIAWAIAALWRALRSGDEERIAAIQGPLVAIVSLEHSLGAFLRIEKLFLQHLGVFKNTLVRPPAGYALDPETQAEALRLFGRLKRACD